MSSSRPNSPTPSGTTPAPHKHVTDIYNMIISENFLAKKNYNELLLKYNDLLAEYKKLCLSIAESGDSSGIMNYLQTKNTSGEPESYFDSSSYDKALPTPINGNITFVPPIHHNPTMNPHPRPRPPKPPTPPVAKLANPKPPHPYPHPPMPHPPIPHPPSTTPKEMEEDEKGWGHHGHWGRWGRWGGHYPHYPPYYPPPYPYPYR